jgi:predicted acetyltransferase
MLTPVAIMDVALTPATVDDKALVGRLLQLYAYDLSDIAGFDVGDDGLFPFPFADGYWVAARYRVFLFRVAASAHLAGFAIVDSQSRFTGEAAWDMNQFFILRRYRRQGLGSSAATALFDAFPGPWEVREAIGNTSAHAFWRAVIGRYTGYGFDEVEYDDATWHGPVQSFNSRGRRGRQ